MTGWRLGYTRERGTRGRHVSDSGPEHVERHVHRSGRGVEALNGPQDFVETMRQAFQERRDIIVHCSTTSWDNVSAAWRRILCLPKHCRIVREAMDT